MSPSVSMKEIARRMFDEDIAVHKIIWLAGSATNSNDYLRELCWDDPDKLIEVLEIADPRGSLDDSGDDDNDEMSSELFLTATAQAGKYGFLIEVATPVQRVFSGGARGDGPYLASWRHYHTALLYVDQIDAQAVDAISAWAQRMHEKDKAAEVDDKKT